MKKLVMTFCMVGILSTTSMLFAFQNEPDGFRGIKWGTDLRDLPDMRPKNDGYFKLCTRKGDKMKIGDADLTNIFYMFYKDRFCGVAIEFKPAYSFDAIKQTLFSVYGEGRQDNPFIETYKWIGGDVRIQLEKGFLEGNLIYSYIPIIKDYLEEEEKRAKEGAKDL